MTREEFLQKIYSPCKFRRRLRLWRAGDWAPTNRYGVYLDNQNIMIHWGSHCWQITWFQEIVQ